VRGAWAHKLGSWPAPLLLCVALGGIIYVEAVSAPIEVAAEAPLVSSEQGSKFAFDEPRFSMPPLSDYSEVVARPLFSSTRKPSPPQSTAANPSEATNLILVGTILGETRHALIRHRQTSSVVERIVEGQNVDGWTVESILSDRVVLRRATSRFELKANDKPPEESRKGAGRSP
jgi:hypothetical protein